MPGYREDVRTLSAKDGAAVIVTVRRATRSDKANAYYWGVVLSRIEAESESGNSANELHDAFCEMFLATAQKQVEFFNKTTGETLAVETNRRSSQLSGAPFYDFVELVREFAGRFWPWIQIPDPDKEYWRRGDEEESAERGAA